MKSKKKNVWLNPEGTYEIQTKDGKTIETFRNIDTARLMFSKIQKQYYEELTIVKIKRTERVTFPK